MDAYRLFQEYLQLQHQIDEFYHELAVRQRLSDSALLVLWTLLELGEGCTQTDICRQFALTKQTVHSSVRKLAKDGFCPSGPVRGGRSWCIPRKRAAPSFKKKFSPSKTPRKPPPGAWERRSWKPCSA